MLLLLPWGLKPQISLTNVNVELRQLKTFPFTTINHSYSLGFLLSSKLYCLIKCLIDQRLLFLYCRANIVFDCAINFLGF